MTRVSEATMQRELNHVLEVELNFVGCQRIRESIERLLQLGFEFFQSSHTLLMAASFTEPCGRYRVSVVVVFLEVALGVVKTDRPEAVNGHVRNLKLIDGR